MATYTDADARKLVMRDMRLLAPGMQDRAEEFVLRCAAAKTPIQVWETQRTHQLARIYYQLGRSHAQDGWRTWHFYGLAVDVIHPVRQWVPWESPDQAAVDWRGSVVAIGKSCGLDWGGDWTSIKDWPHFQFDTLKPSPSDKAIDLYINEGIAGLWKFVGALEGHASLGAPAAPPPPPPPAPVNTIERGVADSFRKMRWLGIGR